MFQRLSSLFFGEVQDVSTELQGPKPSVTDADEEGWLLVNLPEGATAETSPMEDLLIEHPSMSVYVSPSNLSIVEESAASLAASVSIGTDPATPAVQNATHRRVTRGTAAQAGALAKVTQVTRVQRAKARVDRRHLSRNRIQRQNWVRDRAPRHAAHARGTFLHQPCQRSYSH
ncbi:tumor protein p53-inducible nuclear protein 2 isoform X2 [Megalops cyprinoides]|uniref:tumor protein p53-inducible nuclear protein 2 isoform X2 n=1 Tax=Megalops cyprinoides TaxID=118141 RepID=UPI001864CCC6|nr:tumor protein p53-inducible nuclear protein 2 isoform X2 [Megalops cyprinoides]